MLNHQIIIEMIYLKLTERKVLKLFPEFHSEKERHDLLDTYTCSCRKLNNIVFDVTTKSLELLLNRLFAMHGCRGGIDITILRGLIPLMNKEQEKRTYVYFKSFS